MEEELDFGNGDNLTPATEPNDDKVVDNGTDVTPLDGKTTDDITSKSNDTDPDAKDEEDPKETKDNVDDPSTGELSEGDTIEFEGILYTVTKEGSLVDKDGKVFKQADELKEWLKDQLVEESDDSNDISISSIQQALGVDVTDENGNAVEFDNTIEGINDYVNSVIKIKTEEVRQGTLNQFFDNNPIVKDFCNYLVVNGDPRGFGNTVRDLSDFKIDKENIEQQKTIIKLAAQEFGNKSLNDSYINYLADNGALYDEAKQQLDALIEADKNKKEELDKQAAAVIKEQEEAQKRYLDGVHQRIKNRKLGKYTLPESINKKVDGRTITLTLNDFWKYISEPNVKDAEGNATTKYLLDEATISEDELLNKEILNAWLMFTGGSFEDIVKMAINEKEVKKLKLAAKQNRTNKTIRITKNNQKGSINDIVFS